jgi:hypothetical protein
MAGEIPYKIEMPHPEHEKHLCYLENVGYVKANLDDYKKLVRDAKFVGGIHREGKSEFANGDISLTGVVHLFIGGGPR